jgi:hypothetical protein
MVAAVIVGSNALNFSVAIIAFVLTDSSLAAQLTQISVTFQRLIPLGAYRRRSIWTRSSNITIELERSLTRTNHFLASVFYSRMSTGAAGWHLYHRKER